MSATLRQYIDAAHTLAGMGWPTPSVLNGWEIAGSVRAIYYTADTETLDRALEEGTPSEWYCEERPQRSVDVELRGVTVSVIQSVDEYRSRIPLENPPAPLVGAVKAGAVTVITGDVDTIGI